MFSTGMRESNANDKGSVVVPIANISYSVFSQLMYYLYSGEFVLDVDNSVANLDKVIEILGVADAEFLDDVSSGSLD
jgi:hypothetical protein